MSTIKVDSIKSADGNTDLLTLSNGAVSGVIGGRRNLIINGAMQVAQRGTSASAFGYGTVDRFYVQGQNTDELAITQTVEADAPSGFSKSFKIAVTTQESSLASDEYVRVRQAIEGQNLQHLAYGSSSAKELTLSFWVKSSVTGTYSVSFYTFDANRTVGSTYTIDSANTWEYKTITFPADTSGSLPNDDHTEGAYLNWGLSAGSDWTTTDNTSWDTFTNGRFFYGQTADIASTASATWQITGVQLEVGSVATPFEHRSYGEELALCQRYFVSGTFRGSNTQAYAYRINMRDTPSSGTTTGSGSLVLTSKDAFLIGSSAAQNVTVTLTAEL